MTRLKLNDPAKAREHFQAKMDFTLGPVEMREFQKQGFDFNLIDVRNTEDFEKGHIAGAINLPDNEWDNLSSLSKNKMNIVYCYSHVCHLAAKAAVKFASAGFPVMELDGGFAEWIANQFPAERAAA